MDANEYQQLAGRTLIDAPDFAITPEQVLIVWNATGLAGEAGEVSDLIKKGIFHQHGLDRDKLKKELGDVLWYVAALCTKLGFTLDEVMAQNIAKLQVRYPDGYSSAASQVRVDVADEAPPIWTHANCATCAADIFYAGGAWRHTNMAVDHGAHTCAPQPGTLRHQRGGGAAQEPPPGCDSADTHLV